MRRLLVTGASGDLGRPLSALASRSWLTTSTYFSRSQVGGGRPVRVDLRDRAAILRLTEDVSPDVIIHCAGSDRSPDMAQTNRLAAQNIAAAARRAGARLIALSSDMVFDGRNPPYREDSPPAPLSPYGKVKARNEELFLSMPGDCLVVRTSLIYDLDPANRQISWMLERIAQGQRITLFADEIRRPVWALNLAEALLELAVGSECGILQVAGARPVSRFDYGCALLTALGYDPEAIVEKTFAAEVMPDRPRDLSLDLTRARRVLSTPLLSLQEALRRALRRDP